MTLDQQKEEEKKMMNKTILEDFKKQEWLHFRFRNLEKREFQRISSPNEVLDFEPGENLSDEISQNYSNIK